LVVGNPASVESSGFWMWASCVGFGGSRFDVGFGGREAEEDGGGADEAKMSLPSLDPIRSSFVGGGLAGSGGVPPRSPSLFGDASEGEAMEGLSESTGLRGSRPLTGSGGRWTHEPPCLDLGLRGAVVVWGWGGMVAAEEEEGRCGGGVGVGEEETAEGGRGGRRERERERGKDQRERDQGGG